MTGPRKSGEMAGSAWHVFIQSEQRRNYEIVWSETGTRTVLVVWEVMTLVTPRKAALDDPTNLFWSLFLMPALNSIRQCDKGYANGSR